MFVIRHVRGEWLLYVRGVFHGAFQSKSELEEYLDTLFCAH